MLEDHTGGKQPAFPIQYPEMITPVWSQVGTITLLDQAQQSVAFLGHGCDDPDGFHIYSPGCDQSFICILRVPESGKDSNCMHIGNSYIIIYFPGIPMLIKFETPSV
jgi:hypothetical protein